MARDMPSAGSTDGDNIVPNVATVRELWNIWEIHCLVLASLFLQVLLFLFAGMRSRSSSRILGIILWLAYLSADSVAIFVLGNLVIHAEGPRHHLMYFWVPFVLLHLGGQDTITAFSKQDNELWMRHLLNFVTQIAMAVYVVATASWPDRHLKTAMVIMFLSGCFKYAERIVCLFISSPQRISSRSLKHLSSSLQNTKRSLICFGDDIEILKNGAIEQMVYRLALMLEGRWTHWDTDILNIITEDAACSDLLTMLIADDLPDMLRNFQSSDLHSGAYKFVGKSLRYCYQRFHTKHPLRLVLINLFRESFFTIFGWRFHIDGLDGEAVFILLLCIFGSIFILLYIVFQFVSPILALVLFMAAEKGDRLHTSRADITVSYVLLVGTIALQVCSSLSSLRYLPEGVIKSAVCCVASCIQPAVSRKQWSEQLAQYNIVKTHALQSGSLSIRKIVYKLAARLSDITHIPITDCHTTIKKFVLDDLLSLGARNEWIITDSRGKLALQRWMESHEDPDSARVGKALEMSVVNFDFSASVLIWHIATGMCYHCAQNNSSNDSDQMKDDKQVSRELSNYTMYLVFKCKVLLTTSSRLLHEKANNEIHSSLERLHQENPVEEDVFRLLFESKRKKKIRELDSSNLKKLVKSTLDALHTPVLPRARGVAKDLMRIKDSTERWRLIAAVWLEMLYYITPRCGSAFHYKHLSTGGEFVTHVLILMQSLGPFLPPPSA